MIQVDWNQHKMSFKILSFNKSKESIKLIKH